MSLRVAPVTLERANDFVRRFHRHHKPLPGHLFSAGVVKQTRLLDGSPPQRRSSREIT